MNTHKDNGGYKYLVIGGYVISHSDGDRHYVNAKELVRLYGLDMNECCLLEGGDKEDLRGTRTKDYVVLRPRYDGNYQI